MLLLLGSYLLEVSQHLVQDTHTKDMVGPSDDLALMALSWLPVGVNKIGARKGCMNIHGNTPCRLT